MVFETPQTLVVRPTVRLWGVGLCLMAFLLGMSHVAGAQSYNRRHPYCIQLEEQLAKIWVQGQLSRNSLPQIQKKIRKQDRIYNRLSLRAERLNCYETTFIFGRSLRRTPRCLRLDRKIRAAKRELKRLREEAENLRNAGNSYRRDDLISQLARYGCGERYRREARRRSNYFWWGEGGNPFFDEPAPLPRRDYEPEAILPYVTYRTMCVRLCDGYYFPISFSTLPSQFQKDAEACRSRCAAPTRLFVYRNPGGEIEQMTSIDGEPYGALPNAWRYRKEFVKGCSCKPEEYANRPESEGEAGEKEPAQKPGRQSALIPKKSGRQ